MPFPRNYLEELIAEYMQLEGYFVMTDLPRQKEGRGGREEFDVLGVRISGDAKLELWHVEAGRARSMDDREIKIRRQLCHATVGEELKRLFGTAERTKWFVSEDVKETSKKWQDLKAKLRPEKVELVTFEELVWKIDKAMAAWKKRHHPPKSKSATLPENLWLLKMLERMFELKMLNPK